MPRFANIFEVADFLVGHVVGSKERAKLVAQIDAFRAGGEMDRWAHFSDKELREIQQALASAPSAGNHRAHEMIAEITVEANARGPERAEAILHD